MRVTFIQPDFNYVKEYMPDYRGHSSLGIGYLSSSLKKADQSTSLLHLTNEMITKDEFLSSLKKTKPELIAFSFFTHQFDTVKKWIFWAKELNVKIICGGVHATIDPEDVVSVDGVNFVCIGEGEKTLVELCNRLESGKSTNKILGLWVKNDKRIIKNPVRELEENLDSLPFPDKDIYDLKNIADGQMGVLTVIATRGCPYKCSYCCNHQYQKIYAGKGKYVRFRSVDNVIEELRINKEKYPFFRYMELLDDSFVLDKNWVLEFCKEYKKAIGMPFRANTRVNLLTEDIIIALKDAGCERLAMGIETGNEELRSKVLNRHMSNEEIIKAFELCKKYSIETVSYNILGLPFEKIENILETIKLNAKIRPTSMHVSIFQPYPYTKLYEICMANGFIDGKKISFFFGDSVLKQPSISDKEIKFAYKYFVIFTRLYSFIGKVKIIEKVLDRIFCLKMFHRTLLYLYPLLSFFSNPLLFTYRLMLSISPNLTRKIKKTITGRY